MITYIRDEPEPDDGTRFLVGGALALALSALLWVLIIKLISWLVGVLQ